MPLWAQGMAWLYLKFAEISRVSFKLLVSWLGPHSPLVSSPEKDLGQAGSRQDKRREKQGVIPCKAGTKAGVGASHIPTPAPWPLGLLIGLWVQPP